MPNLKDALAESAQSTCPVDAPTGPLTCAAAPERVEQQVPREYGLARRSARSRDPGMASGMWRAHHVCLKISGRGAVILSHYKTDLANTARACPAQQDRIWQCLNGKEGLEPGCCFAAAGRNMAWIDSSRLRRSILRAAPLVLAHRSGKRSHHIQAL